MGIKSRVFAKVVYYPTLWWNRLNYMLGNYRWWDWVDERVLLGAMPHARDADALHREGISAVVNTCEEYDGPREAYQRLGIEQLHIPTVDFTPPTLEQMREAVQFIRKRTDSGGKVYIHCKAGRGRSATVAVCYLISLGLTPEQAQAKVSGVRPQVLSTIYKRDVVIQFAKESHAKK